MSDRSPLDRAIAERLSRLTSNEPPAAPSGLTEAVRLGRRSRVRRVRVGVATAALLLVLVPLGAVTVGWSLRHADQPTPAAGALLGGYSADVAASPPGTHGMAGRWDLVFLGNGTLRVSAPPGYSGILTGFHYSRSADEVRVDLFTQDLCADLPVGVYAWAQVGGGVQFHAVDDTCTARVALLTGRTWTGLGTG